jgi:hypothetical protein
MVTDDEKSRKYFQTTVKNDYLTVGWGLKRKDSSGMQ